MPSGVLLVNYMVKYGQSGWTKLDPDWQNYKISKKLCYELASFKMVNNRAHTCTWGVEGVLQRQGVDTPSTVELFENE